MSLAHQLYEDWLPALYRLRDAAVAGGHADQGPLRALLEILGREGDRLDRDLEQLLDNWFIETAEDWVIPYLADLLGVRDLPSADGGMVSPRAYVANTLRYRRRKGTAAMLEQLARDTTGWPAAAVEFFSRLDTTQHLNHLRPGHWRTPDLRAATPLERLGTPFETANRTAEVRRIEPRRGRWNIPNLGLFLWRLRAYPLRAVPCFDHGGGRFSLSTLGQDAPLFHRPETEPSITHLATEANVPIPIRRRPFHEQPADFYGSSLASPRDLFLIADGLPIDVSRLQACHLGGWIRQPDPGRVAVDPLLGRVSFPPGESPTELQACLAYGFSADLGGGTYERDLWPAPAGASRYPIGGSSGAGTLADAVNAWVTDGRPDAIFEIVDQAVYPETAAGGSVAIAIPAGRTVVLRAGRDAAFAEFQRPLLRLAGGLVITGEPPASPDAPGARFVFEGLWLESGPLTVAAGDLGELILRHCTLVPGGALNLDGTPATPGAQSLQVATGNPRLAITLDRTIAGAITMASAASLTLRDSIVEAHGLDAIDAPTFHADSATVFGRTRATVIGLANGSLFTGAIVAQRRQEGCVRYCYLPEDSLVPRRHRCQPDHAIAQAVNDEEQRLGRKLTAAERDALQAPIVARIQPLFTDQRFGQPGYAQLHRRIASEIAEGADDENEVGAFHHLKQATRLRFLGSALAEYLRAGLEAGLFTES